MRLDTKISRAFAFCPARDYSPEADHVASAP